MIRHCKDCKFCRDVEYAKEVGCSKDCFYVNYCDPIGGHDYFKEREKKRLILLCGKKRVGKDTVADYLVKIYNFTKYSFADPMKKACKEIFMLDDEQLWGDDKEIIDDKLGTTPRKLLQIFGTELFQFDIYNYIPELLNKIPIRTLWVQRFKWWYEDHKHENIVISDGRFLHELEAIEDMGGILILIEREQTENIEDNHKSEKNIGKIIDLVDIMISNNDDFSHLYNQVDNIMNMLFKNKNEN